MAPPTPSDWDVYTPAYALNFLHRSLPHSSDILSLLLPEISTSTTLLDLCCGPGTFLLSYARHFPRGIPNQTLVCVDSSPQMIQHARENARRWLPPDFRTKLVFMVADAGDMTEIGEGSVDVVVSCLGVFLVEAQVKVLNEVRRVLRRDGVFGATAWTRVQGLEGLEENGFGPMISKIMNPVMGMLLEGAVEEKMEGAWMIWADEKRVKGHLEGFGFERVRVCRSIHTQTVSEEDVWKMITETSPMGYRGGASEEKLGEALELLKTLVSEQEEDRFFVSFLANVVVARNVHS